MTRRISIKAKEPHHKQNQFGWFQKPGSENSFLNEFSKISNVRNERCTVSEKSLQKSILIHLWKQQEDLLDH